MQSEALGNFKQFKVIVRDLSCWFFLRKKTHGFISYRNVFKQYTNIFSFYRLLIPLVEEVRRLTELLHSSRSSASASVCPAASRALPTQPGHAILRLSRKARPGASKGLTLPIGSSMSLLHTWPNRPSLFRCRIAEIHSRPHLRSNTSFVTMSLSACHVPQHSPVWVDQQIVKLLR